MSLVQSQLQQFAARRRQLTSEQFYEQAHLWVVQRQGCLHYAGAASDVVVPVSDHHVHW